MVSISFHFPDGSVVKNPPANAGDVGLIPGSGRSPGVGNSNPPQYSCLGNPTDRGAWQATVQSHKELDMTEQLSTWTVGPKPGLVNMRGRNPTSYPIERETEISLLTRRTCSLMVSSSVRSSPASRLIQTIFPEQR